MQQNSEPIYLLIGKFISEEINEAEHQILNQWLSESDDNNTLFDRIRHDNEMIGLYRDLKNLDTEKARELTWLKIRKFDKLKEDTEHRIYSEMKRKVTRNMMRYAAGIALLIGLAWGSIFYIGHSSKTSPIPMVQITAPKGSRTNVKLADGTSVWLNAGSVLSYSNEFNKKDRIVFLEGEAFFDVTKNVQKPFFVKTPFISMRVVGTTFNVKSYPEEGITQTTLVTGIVVLERNNVKETGSAPVILRPNQRATFIKKQNKMVVDELPEQSPTASVKTPPDVTPAVTTDKENEIIVADKINVEKDISWKDGYLVIEHESLEKMIQILARRYDVSFVFKSEDIKKYKYTGKINDLTLDQVLNAIKISSPIDYKIEGKIVTIHKKK